MIELRQIEKIYQRQGVAAVALAKIDLVIDEGNIFGIIGKSGAGKSTLLRCINGLEKPSYGEVLLNGIAINHLSESQLLQVRRKIGMIFQHFNLLNSRTVFDNVALPLEIQGLAAKTIRLKVTDLLSLVGLSDKAAAYPTELSGGQKQRVAIARALVTDPEVLLCDEATSALDPETTQAILALLKKINQQLGITIVLITHEMEVIKQICHEVAVLDQGKLIEQGSVIDLFTRPKTALAKRLTSTTFHAELPSAISETLQENSEPHLYPVVKLAFVGEQSKQPLISELMKRYQVAANILLADIETVDDTTIGVTVCQLLGESACVASALNYLEKNIAVEVLGYAS